MTECPEITDAGPRQEFLDFRCVRLYNLPAPVGFPLLKMYVATRCRCLKVIGNQVSHELDRVGGDSTADWAWNKDCDAILSRPFDEETLFLQG